MARPRKIAAKVTDVKKLRTYRTRTEETQEEVKPKEVDEIKKITPEPSPKGHMETVVQEEYYNACKQNLQLGGQRFVPGAIIPKDFLTEDSIKFYLQGGHIASRKKLRTVRKLN